MVDSSCFLLRNSDLIFKAYCDLVMKLGKRIISIMILLSFIMPLFLNVVQTQTGDQKSIILRGESISQVEPDFITYLGGDGQEDASKIAMDAEGSTILIGQTKSDDFPVTPDAIQTTYSGTGEWDSFVTKFNPDGSLNFSTYLGGPSYEHITTVTTDSELNIILAGVTFSAVFPVTEDALLGTHQGSGDGFIIKMRPNGSLIYSTYFGGSGEEWIYGMEFDAEGNYMFSGFTDTTGLATSGVYQNSIAGGTDAFVAKLSADGQSILAFSYFGGSGVEYGWCMTIDSEYNYLISGRTTSTNLPLTGETYQDTYGGAEDAYLAKISSDCTSLNFSTYVGGGSEDVGGGIDVDGADNIYLAGFTESDDLTTMNAMQSSYGGGTHDGYFAKFSKNGSGEFVSYFGGNKSDRVWDLRVDPAGNIALIGRTYSDNLPIQNAIQPTRAGLEDMFATKICSCGLIILVSTYYGGTGTDFGEGIAINAEGHIVVSGMSYSSGLPVTANAFQPTRAGSTDAIVVHDIFESPITTPFTSSSTSSTDTSTIIQTTSTTSSSTSSIATTKTTSPTTPVQGDNTFILILAAGIGAVVVLVIIVSTLMRRR